MHQFTQQEENDLAELKRKYNSVSEQLYLEERKLKKLEVNDRDVSEQLCKFYKKEQIEIDDTRTKIYLRSIDK